MNIGSPGRFAGYIGFACIALISLGLPANASRHDKVAVSRISFDGWPDCVRISNGIVEAVVVPQIGRVMEFEFAGDTSSNPIYINPELAGKTAATNGVGPNDWANYGGSKVWPSPQSSWPSYIGRTWPPDPTLDGQPYDVQNVRNGVRISSPLSSKFGLEIVRTITMQPGAPQLHMIEAISRPTDLDFPADSPGNRLGVWTNAQTRGDGTIFLPLAPDAAVFPKGFVTFDGQSRPSLDPPALPTGWSRIGDMLVGRRDPVGSQKIGVADSIGWIASLYRGDTLFVQRFGVEPIGASQSDAGCRAEVYTQTGDFGYIEMELLGPLKQNAIGTSEQMKVDWELVRLAHAPRTDADAVADISAVATGRNPGATNGSAQ